MMKGLPMGQLFDNNSQTDVGTSRNLHETVVTAAVLVFLAAVLAACPPPTDVVTTEVDATAEVQVGGETETGTPPDPVKCANFETDGSCGDCTPGSCGPSGRCHPDRGVCVQCVLDDDCGAGVCHPNAFVCVACWADNHCPEGFCDDKSNMCVGCTMDTDCSVGVCNTDIGACVGGCKGDLDCGDDNPCTSDRCDDDNECVYLTQPDGTGCNDGDPCTGDGFCLTGACVAGRQQCCEAPPKCGVFAVLADTDDDGCADTCACEDGTSFNALGDCTPICDPLGVTCPAGSAPADTDSDGCADDCACVDSGCIACSDDSACDDGDACSQDLCVNGICLSVTVPNCGACETSCDCLDIGAPDKFAPNCPLKCATCGNWWGCVEGSCTVTCGAQPAGLATCGCVPVTCEAGGMPTDTTDDGCADACLCADGQVALPGEPCDAGVGKPCVTGCDCIDTTLVSTDACSDQCVGCKAQWACVAGTCQEACGILPLGSSSCSGKELCVATGGTYDDSACGDYYCGDPAECLAVTGGCNCGPGALFDPLHGCAASDLCSNGLPACPPIGCDSAFGGFDQDGDGCNDVCLCSTSTGCASEQLCLKPPAGCSNLGTCVAKPSACLDPGGQGVCTCNGAFYPSACEAHLAGESVATSGVASCPAP